jgi:NAD(P)-dependent dehydrogenase (short-subunit alcohol dehydrogenase family)
LRVVCITGAGHGIGRATALAVARDGAAVVAADVDEASAKETALAIQESGGRSTGVGCDVTDEEQARAMIGAAAQLGGLDCLINNAGIYPRQELATMAPDDLDAVLRVNVRGPLVCTLAAVPLLEERHGHVIFVGSGSAHPGSAQHAQGRYFPFYGASKAAIERLVASFAVELAPIGISTSIFRPPATRTEGSLATNLSREELEGMADAEDVAIGLAWLAAQASMPVNGQTFESPEFGQTWGR